MEKFLDAVLAIQEHIEPGLIKPYRLVYPQASQRLLRRHRPSQPAVIEDLWALDPDDEQEAAEEQENLEETPKPFPPQPEKDLMWFIQEYSTELTDWQRDIMTMLA